MRSIPAAMLAGLVALLVLAPTAQSQTPAPSAADTAEIARTRAVLEAYWEAHDPRYVAPDAIFTMMPTGQEIHGRDAIAEHLHDFYHVAFDARADRMSATFGVGRGLLEAMVVGRHTGEFAGTPATGREIRVPLAVAYEVENGLITRARIYLMLNLLLAQISDPAP